jgi:hypothetical protein
MNAVDLEKLRTPFPAGDLEWKVQRCGLKGAEPWAIIVPYVDARAIMKRLDEVAGPENWQSRLVPTANGMLCELSLRLGGEWITKMDGSDETDYEPFKGGISKALVRAAVHWGIGRDLYTLPTMFARFVEKSTPGAHFAKVEGKDFWWVPNQKGAAENPVAAPARQSAPTAAPVPAAPVPAAKAEAPPAAYGAVNTPVAAVAREQVNAPVANVAREQVNAHVATVAREQVNAHVATVAREQVNRPVATVNSMAPVAQGTAPSARSATVTATRPAPRASTAPVAATAPAAPLTSEAVVPFGHNQGKRLGELSDSELAGLADFYARVPEPKGKAKLFKRDFDKYMTTRSRAS